MVLLKKSFDQFDYYPSWLLCTLDPHYFSFETWSFWAD